MKIALEAMGYRGVSLEQAALEGHLQPESVRAALRKPHVKNALNQLISEIRSNSAQLAFVRINKLSEVAASEDVKLRANQWVAGVDGIAAVKLVSGKVAHSVTFKGFAYDDGDEVQAAPDQAKDVTPQDTLSGGDDA